MLQKVFSHLQISDCEMRSSLDEHPINEQRGFMPGFRPGPGAILVSVHGGLLKYVDLYRYA